ncbi:MAG: LysR family transcriptional regulator [Labilithrix sp.]|nr:LysR family transcriptional regulator [Labilithrix sp.]MCW5834918.1 LysR family transcriptional regulator [Labilithrix sp.]
MGTTTRTGTTTRAASPSRARRAEHASLDDLAVFVAVGETLGISAAAARLRVPKSSVSRALARLEDAMGARLVHRTTRRLSLSTAGAELLERAGPMVATLGETLRAAHEAEEAPAGRLRITCTVDFGATVLAEIVTRFMARHPRVEVDVVLSNSVVDLVRHGVDLAIRFSPKRLRDSSLVAKRIGSLTTMLVASPAYLKRRGAPRSPRDLAEHDWVTYSGVASIVLEAPEGAASLAARGRLRCDDMFFARAASRAGAGIVALPAFLAEEDVAAGLLVPVLPRWRASRGAMWLVSPASRNVPAKVTAFSAFLVEELTRARAG